VVAVRIEADAGHRQDAEALLLQRGNQTGVDERGLAGSRRRVQQDDALGDQQVEEVEHLTVPAVELLALPERSRAHEGVVGLPGAPPGVI